MADVVEVILALRNARQFTSESEQAAHAVGDIGDASEKAGKKAGLGWKGIAKWGGAAAAVYAGTRFLKSAVSATEGLAKSTIALQRSTNMDTETASEWVALTKERGISTKMVQTALVKLSRNMDKANVGTRDASKTIKDLRAQIDAVTAAGGKDAPKSLAKLSAALARAQKSGEKSSSVLTDLGVPLKAIQSGDTNATLMSVADAFEKINDPAKRLATAQALFGRQGIALLPILMKGRKGVQELLDKQKDYGNYLQGKSVDDTKKLIEQQRELEGRFAGVKVQLGTALLPIMIQAGKILVKIAQVLSPVTRNTALFTAAIIALTTAFVGFKVAMIVATIASSGLSASMLIWAGIVILIIAALVGLAIGVIYLYRHWKWFHNAVDDTWKALKVAAHWIVLSFRAIVAAVGRAIDWMRVATQRVVATFHRIVTAVGAAVDWIRRNWMLLVAILAGPFAVAAYEIYRHFDAIKRYAASAVSAVSGGFHHVAAVATGVGGAIRRAFSNAIGWVKANWPLLLGILTGPFGLAVVTIVRHLGAIERKAKAIVAAIKGAFQDLLTYIAAIPSKVTGLLGKGAGFMGKIATKVLPGAAEGGIVSRSGTVVVGERGPELLTLPAPASVQPLPAHLSAVGGFGGGTLEITVPVMIDGREIGRAVARTTADRLARR